MAPLLEAERVNVSFGGLRAVVDVSLEVRAGTCTAVIGPNGAGKTTLINAISGITPMTSGTIRIQGKVPSRWSLSRAARAGVTRTFQGTRLFNSMTVIEHVATASLNTGTAVDPRAILERLALTHRQNDTPSELPFGEARRLGVALALATDPRTLLLDEPGVGLTGQDLLLLTRCIKEFAADGKGVVLVDHNMRFVMDIADEVIVMEGGAVIAKGLPVEVRSNPAVLKAYLGGSPHA